MRPLIATLVVLLAVELAAQAPRPPETMAMYLQGRYNTLKRNLTGAAEKMPTSLSRWWPKYVSYLKRATR